MRASRANVAAVLMVLAISGASTAQTVPRAEDVKDWKILLRADAAHGRRVLRVLRSERVVVRRDDQGRWREVTQQRYGSGLHSEIARIV